ncbi:phosphoserine aminotransferase [Macrolepiota fuliginosa MF-IS2]|uniref:phosphoserine transaminase n=1 Tax=Macrolepiota fuliginosa MF-IS2 TaxID=1400762 RepID=A0A9P6C8J2_9AGAR|nr:phosphoserine aminotransferase [Macrolepiota fuliginosa MF-IS2]
MSAASRVINFGAGPSALPDSVLQEATKGLLNFENTGIGIAEISHRSPEFTSYLAGVEALIRQQLGVPSTHSIFFTQGGGTGQFSAVVLNLLARHRLLYPDLRDEERGLDYVLTGSWSKAAHTEGLRLGGGQVNIVVDGRLHSKDAKSFDNIPPHASFKFSPNPALIYYCENETVHGVQFNHAPESIDSEGKSVEGTFPFHLLPQGQLAPLVGDYSSSFMSRPIPRLADHAVIYAGAQKNIGPAGLTILIVRNDCIVDVDAAAKLGAQPIPITLSYKTLADGKSVYNTPPVLAIYISGLVLKRNSELGGVKYYERVNKKKAEKVYEVVREGEEKGVFRGHVQEGSRSWMNIVFVVLGDGKEKAFLQGAEEKGMTGLKGHRSVGGIRISLYNAITEEQTDKLVAYIREFLESQ